jgi:hypothetical protein
MEAIHFNYAYRLKKYSNLIYNWCADNNLGLFDFDSYMYSRDSYYLLKDHLTWVAANYNKLLIVENHPFFETDEKYISTKNEILKIANQLNLDLYFLTADYQHWGNSLTNECFYPNWYFELRCHALQNNYREFDWPITRKYNFSCNNRSNYRSEKIYNYIECFRRYRKDWIISIYDHPHAEISKLDLNNVQKINEDQIKIWNEQIKHKINFYKPDLYNQEQHNAMNTLFSGHVDSYCNLVMEHSMEIEILSEKSFKPFISKQIPVYLAHAGACTFLTKLGFDLFYDFVDHSKYDSIGLGCKDRFPETWVERVDRVHELIDNLYTTNFTDFFHDPNTKQRLQNNQDYFYSDAIDKLCVYHFDQLLNKY